MRNYLIFTSFFLSLSTFASDTKNFFELSAKSITGKVVNFSTYRGNVILVVNTASQCGFTPQLKDLEEIYKQYSSKGFIVLGFPSNDFKQEKGENVEVQTYAKNEYGISFQLFDKAPVTGPNKQLVYKFLTDSKPGLLFKEVTWNFEKFLINRKGDVIERYSSMTRPNSASVKKDIEKALKEPF
jgi:glutathione peroxidase